MKVTPRRVTTQHRGVPANFRYDATTRTWLLHRDGHERFHALDPEHGTSTATIAKNFGRVPLAKFDICKE